MVVWRSIIHVDKELLHYGLRAVQSSNDQIEDILRKVSLPQCVLLRWIKTIRSRAVELVDYSTQFISITRKVRLVCELAQGLLDLLLSGDTVRCVVAGSTLDSMLDKEPVSQ